MKCLYSDNDDCYCNNQINNNSQFCDFHSEQLKNIIELIKIEMQIAKEQFILNILNEIAERLQSEQKTN
jgi:hypothetical protein